MLRVASKVPRWVGWPVMSPATTPSLAQRLVVRWGIIEPR